MQVSTADWKLHLEFIHYYWVTII